MKLTKSLLIVTLACGTLWAQAPADKTAKPTSKTPPTASKNATPVKTPVATPKPAMAAPAKTATKTAVKPVVKEKPAAKPMMGKTAPVAVAKKPMAHEKPLATRMASPMAAKKKAPKVEEMGAAKPASVKEKTTATRVTGKQRDPFVSPVVRSGGNIGSGCDTGKRCLVVDQIVLKGIVKSPAGFIAVVENPAKRAYFMRENDPVFNGKIIKITGDTVVFQEQVMDKVGKQSLREVVKKVNAPIV